MNKILKSKALVGTLVMTLALFGFVFSSNNASAAAGEGTATVAPTTVVQNASTVFTSILTVGVTGISPTANNPTFAIPANFTAPSATPVASAAAVTAGVDGNWFAAGAGGSCAAVGLSATGQVITVDVTAQCATTNTITLTYRGTSSALAGATPLVISTADVSPTALAPIAAQPTIAVTLDAVAPTFTAARTGLNTFLVTFNKPVNGSAIANSFTVAGATLPVLNTAVTGGTTTTLTTTGLTLPGSAVTVGYNAAVGNFASTATPPVLLATITPGPAAPATDVTLPTYTASQTGINTFVLTFSEPVTGTVTSGSFTVAGSTPPVINTAPTASTSVTLTTTGLTVLGPVLVNYVPAVGDIADLSGNEVAATNVTSTVNVPAGGGGLTTGGGGVLTGDTTPPFNTSVTINGGAVTTNSLLVTLTLAASDATQMMIANDSSFSGSSWETFNTSKSWNLTSGDGVKTVWAEFRDASLNVSSPVSDSITVSGSGTVANNNPVSQPVTVMVAGCMTNVGFSATTGQSCATNTVFTNQVSIPGCMSNVGFSPTTGQSCATNTVNNGTMFIAGCGNSNVGFSNVSGMSCANNAVMQQTPIAGCGNSNVGFSNVNGMSCATNPVSVNLGTGVDDFNFGTKTLRNGSKGEEVKEVQAFLNKFENAGLVTDGSMGAKTVTAVKNWQSAHSLVADGVLGPKSMAEMHDWASTH